MAGQVDFQLTTRFIGVKATALTERVGVGGKDRTAVGSSLPSPHLEVNSADKADNEGRTASRMGTTHN